MADAAGVRALPAGGTMIDATGTAGRLAANWVYGGALAAVVLLALVPVFAAAMPLSVLLVFLGLPAYMVHQLEEHDDDRFRRFMNALLRPRHRGLTVADVFVINVGGVWGTFVVAILAAALVAPGWGVFVAWALVVNGTLHVFQGIGLRRYNPGLGTAIAVFLPLGVLQLAVLWDATSGLQHAVGLGAAIALHVAILVTALRPAERAV